MERWTGELGLGKNMLRIHVRNVADAPVLARTPQELPPKKFGAIFVLKRLYETSVGTSAKPVESGSHPDGRN